MQFYGYVEPRCAHSLNVMINIQHILVRHPKCRGLVPGPMTYTAYVLLFIEIVAGGYKASSVVVVVGTVSRRRADQVLGKSEAIRRLLPVVRRAAGQCRAMH